MLKEIFEQPKAVADTLIGRLSDNNQILLDELHMSADEIRSLKKITVIACGTAYHAGMVAKYAIEKWAKIPVDVEIASEFRYRDPIIDPSTLIIAISQSGETMDTLMAVRHAKAAGGRVLSAFAIQIAQRFLANQDAVCTPMPVLRSRLHHQSFIDADHRRVPHWVTSLAK